MPAKTKDDLLCVTQKEFAKLAKLIAPLGPAQVRQADADGITIKDIVGHRAHWIALFLGWYADGQAGKEVFFPAEGYKWNDLPRYNADLRQAQSDLGWDDVCALLDAHHARLVAFIEKQPDKALYGGPMKGGRNAWTTGRWAEAAGPSHYRSATKYIRVRLRDLPPA